MKQQLLQSFITGYFGSVDNGLFHCVADKRLPDISSARSRSFSMKMSVEPLWKRFQK